MKFVWIAFALLAVVLPCSPLFNLRVNFPSDWFLHLFALNYCACFFQAHHTFPSVINTTQVAGMANPLFYGYLFYPTLALFATKYDGGLSIRLVVSALFSLQFCLYFTLLKNKTGKLLAFSLASMLSWAVYPLTNLYHRGAVNEFCATTALFCSIAFGFFALAATSKLKRFLCANLAVVFWTFAAGSHPITAVYGLISTVLIAGLAIYTRRKESVMKEFAVNIALPCVLSLLCLFPWAYAAATNTPVIESSFAQPLYYPTTIDSVFGRLSPLPVRPIFLEENLEKANIHLKFLDAQISISLLLLFIYTGVVLLKNIRTEERPGRSTLLSYAMSSLMVAVFLLLSLIPGSMNDLPLFLKGVLFPYRLVTYINLFLLVGTISPYLLTETNDLARVRKAILPKWCVYLALALAFVALGIKLAHAFEVAIPNPRASRVRTWSDRQMLTNLPDSYYSYSEYAAQKLYPQPSENQRVINQARIAFLPGLNKQFGTIQNVLVSARSGGGILPTNLQEFAWNKIEPQPSDTPVKLYELNPSREHVDSRLGYAKIIGVETDAKSLSYVFDPPQIWKVSNSFAVPLFHLWGLLSIIAGIFVWIKARLGCAKQDKMVCTGDM